MTLQVFGAINKRYSTFLNILQRAGVKDCLLATTGTLGIRNSNDLKELGELNKHLVDINCTLVACRGIGDNHVFFSGEDGYSNIILQKDFNIYQGIMFIGGGVPADRSIKGINYIMPSVKGNAATLVQLLGKVPVVVSHWAPELASPLASASQKYWKKYDPSLLEDCQELSSNLNFVYTAIRPTYWFFGYPNIFKITNHGGTTFISLTPEMYGVEYSHS